MHLPLTKRLLEAYVPVSDYFAKPYVHAPWGVKPDEVKHGVPTLIPVELLEPCQEEVDATWVKKYQDNPPSELPQVLLHDGRYFVGNHTRTAAQIASGAKEVRATLFVHDGKHIIAPHAWPEEVYRKHALNEAALTEDPDEASFEGPYGGQFTLDWVDKGAVCFGWHEGKFLSVVNGDPLVKAVKGWYSTTDTSMDHRVNGSATHWVLAWLEVYQRDPSNWPTVDSLADDERPGRDFFEVCGRAWYQNDSKSLYVAFWGSTKEVRSFFHNTVLKLSSASVEYVWIQTQDMPDDVWMPFSHGAKALAWANDEVDVDIDKVDAEKMTEIKRLSMLLHTALPNEKAYIRAEIARLRGDAEDEPEASGPGAKKSAALARNAGFRSPAEYNHHRHVESVQTEAKVVSLPQQLNNLIVVIGAPGSGKSKALNLINADFVHLTTDRFTELYMSDRGIDASSPANVSLAHRLVGDKFKTLRRHVVNNAKFTNVVIETIGASTDVQKLMLDAAHRGWCVTTVLVEVPLSVAMKGNATRQRQVDPALVQDAWQSAHQAFEVLTDYAEHAWVIRNSLTTGRPGYHDFRTGNLIQKVK